MTEPQPAADNLQFRRAEPLQDAALEDGSIGDRCVACKARIGATYYHAAGRKVCPECAQRIQGGQQAPPATSLAKAFLYGGGAAFAGFAIYAAVAIVLHVEVALIAILVGHMVGKAIRKGSGGLGGRPQQILAVLLTYFAITTSYVPVYVYDMIQKHSPTAEQGAEKKATPTAVAPTAEKPSLAAALVVLVLLFAAAPFLGLSHGSGFLTLFIIFFGLSRAWRLTGRTNILIMGPYESPAAASSSASAAISE